MMAALSELWAQRTPRERLLLGVMAALALALGYWLLAWRPLQAAADRSQARLERMVGDFRAFRAAAPSLQAAAATAAGPPAPLRQRISDAAQRHGVTLARVQPDGSGVAVGVDAVGPAALWRWVLDVEQSGAAVERLSVRKGPGETLDAQVTFGGGA